MVDVTFLAHALLLGMVATFNPCGFALLPAYITMLVTGTADQKLSRPTALRRALTFGTAMTIGFLGIFTAFGLLFGGVSLALQSSILPVMPYVTVVLGLLLVVLGIVVVRLGELRGPGLRFAAKAPGRRFASQVLYGVGFGLASLTCTIGLFLAIVIRALAATDPVNAIVPFLAYALGMGAVVIGISLVAAVAGTGIAIAIRRRTATIVRVGGALMVVAGVYVVVFGLSEVLPDFGIDALDPVLRTTLVWQGAVVNAVDSWGTAVLITLVALVAVAVAAILVWERRTRAIAKTGPESDS